MRFKPISPEIAVSLFEALIVARGLQLQPALDRAVQAIGVPMIDTELHRLVPTDSLNYLAGLHLRGELVFPVPSIIRHAPCLIGYYRMLLGISKKDFAQANKLGYGTWANAEARNALSRRLDPYVEDLCVTMIVPLVALLDKTRSLKPLDDRDLNDLALLTLGPTLQGGRNNVIGQQAARGVFDALRDLLKPWLTRDSAALIQFRNESDRRYELAVASDPDIRLDELVETETGITSARLPVLVMEIKGGRDASNVHNRAGEAEKSQIKAAADGYQGQWTIMVLARLDRDRLRMETPSSTELFDADQIMRRAGTDWQAFTQKLSAIIGILLL